MEESLIPTVVTVEEQINQELVKANVTEAIIAALKEKYLPLQIDGLDDKETYLEVKEARKECKALRVMAEKICKKGREEAVAIQKAWVAKEKDVAGRIGEVEDHLEKQEKDYEAAVAKEKEERRRKQEEQFILRQQALTGMSALYCEGNFVLGDVSFEYSLIKEADQDIWESDILPKFQAEFQKVEAERIEADRLKKEKEDEFKRQQEEFERRQQELAQKEAALKVAQEEQERKEQERIIEAERVKKEVAEKTFQDRLTRGHYNFNGFTVSYKGEVFGSKADLVAIPQEDFEKLVAARDLEISEEKAAAEQKRLAEIEAQLEAGRIKAIGDMRSGILKQFGMYEEAKITEEVVGNMSEDEWEIFFGGWKDIYEKRQRAQLEKEQEEKRKAEELKKQQEMEQAKDKEKWREMMEQINAVIVFDMRSSQYRKKAMMFREKLEEIKALDNG